MLNPPLLRNTYIISNRKLLAYLTLTSIVVLLLLPAILITFNNYSHWYLKNIKDISLSSLFFLMPLVFFYRNIKVYFYLLSMLIVLTPLFIFSIILFNVKPDYELVVFVLQTNASEIKELVQSYFSIFIGSIIVLITVYIYLVKKMAFKRLPFDAACKISLISAVMLISFLFYEKQKHQMNKYDLLSQYYPASLISGIAEAYSFINKTNIGQAKNFYFDAIKIDSLPLRKIFVFIIGETSRYDRWQINGYPKPTSPRLADRQHLISFKNVVAGSNLTWMSVPQMITRAHADDIDLQFREKSIISAFKEAGFKTAWLSNQPSNQELFWSGTIGLHAKTADFAVFSPTSSPNFQFEDLFDGRLLPMLDSLIKSDQKDLFVVLHTTGNHWDYFRRYPKEFDYFKPSGYTQNINPPNSENKEAVSNSYDNSILYADYLIDSVISTVQKYKAISYVSFLSDHGEDLFDADPYHIDYHLNHSEKTLHVPLFIWTSDIYRQIYLDKMVALQSNKDRKVGSENTFYTLLDMANIDFKGNDTCKSLANTSFRGSKQRYYSNKDKRGYNYHDLGKK